MTRLFTCGFETGDVNEGAILNGISANTTHTAVNSTPTPRAGAYCLKITCSVATWPSSWRGFSLPTTKTDIWTRWAVYLHPASTTGEWVIFATQDSTPAVQISVTWSITDNLLRLYRATAGVLLATSSATMSADNWHVLEVRHQITSTSAGIAEVWLDGVRVINFSGDVCNTANANVKFALFGTINNVITTGNATGAYMGVDDIAINDTAGSFNTGRIGDGRVILLVPTGAGSSTVLARGGTDTGANWSQTSELPPSLAQYVASAAVGDRDLYAMSNLGVPAVASINVVEELVLAQNSDAGAGSLGLTIKSGATTNEATAQALTGSATYFGARWETDPNTSAAWTATAVDALEAGVTVR